MKGSGGGAAVEIGKKKETLEIACWWGYTYFGRELPNRHGSKRQIDYWNVIPS